MSTLAPNEVFTPGKLPIRPGNVYAKRGESERDFEKALSRGLIPVVYGEYGVGKTSMARYVLKQEEEMGHLVNIESVADKNLEEVFERCLEKIDYSFQKKKVTSGSSSTSLEETMQVEANIGWLKGILSSKRVKGKGSTEQVEEEKAILSPTESKLIELCEEYNIKLIIDELHRASPEFTDSLAKFIKAYGNANCYRFKIALLGTSSEASRLVKSDPGIDRLLQEIHLKAMSEEEATFVVDKGMGDLTIETLSEVVEKLVTTSVGSPNILQYLCLETAEACFDRMPRTAELSDVNAALKEYVEKKEARLYHTYMKAIETVGGSRYRKQILHAMSETEHEYVTMEDIRSRVSTNLSRNVPSTALSGPLRDLKDPKFGSVLSDVERPDQNGRMLNYTTFHDPALKAFIRMQMLRESEIG